MSRLFNYEAHATECVTGEIAWDAVQTVQWKRKFSAFETADSWEHASKSLSGILTPIEALLGEPHYRETVFVIFGDCRAQG